MLLEENKPLAPFTTLGVGGPARWFVDAAIEDEIVEATGWATQRGLPLFVLGGGSNLLVSDAGFNGLVLRVGIKGIFAPKNTHPKSEPDDPWLYSVAAGENWDSFVESTVQDNCAGLECLAGIPGTVGGTPVQNVGAYGQEVSSTIGSVRVFDLREGLFRQFTNAECEFGYRHSRFNSADRGRFIVTRVDYHLKPGGAPALRYADLQRAFPAGAQPGLAEVAATVRRIRQSKGMLLVEGDPDCRSAGSFFKNPIVTTQQADHIAHTAQKELPRFPAGLGTQFADRVKLPAAWLIEQAGFHKGYVRGQAGLSSRHTLALINRGNASAADIVALAGAIRDTVRQRFGVALEMEPVMLGF
ncbi:MAG TPA: UDP-N-acetylmuramate dehydrogenase [Terracidiphilus sp.]|jgi:UDP-N-acetylmuramate dehydrogenase|nr:UDP-N-acetylmuramate dehydrogenase [Terracidiphilus sp.]